MPKKTQKEIIDYALRFLLSNWNTDNEEDLDISEGEMQEFIKRWQQNYKKYPDNLISAINSYWK